MEHKGFSFECSRARKKNNHFVTFDCVRAVLVSPKVSSLILSLSYLTICGIAKTVVIDKDKVKQI